MPSPSRLRRLLYLIPCWLGPWLPATALAAPPAPTAGTPPGPGTDAVSRASPASSDKPVVTGGSVDGTALRARNRKRLAEDHAPVTLLQGKGPLELGQRICEQVVPKRSPDTPVLLKPNLGGFDWFKRVKQPGDDDGLRGRITQPEFVRGIIRCLKARGHTHITVADGWDSPHADWLRLARLSGYEAMTREEGVTLAALDDDGVFDVQGDQPAKPMVVTGMDKTNVPTLLVSKLVAEHLQKGLFISVPKLKAHRFGVVSIALKGMQGVVMLSDGSPAHVQKHRMHREINGYLKARKKGLPEGPGERAQYVDALGKFAERISDVLEIEAPDVVLVDGAPFMGGDGFQQLYPSKEMVALGGTNPVLVDRVGAELLGLWNSAALARELGGHTTSPLLETAARRFGVDIRDPAVTGDGVALLKQPRAVHYIAMAPFAFHQEAAAAATPPAPAVAAGETTAHAASLGGAPAPVIDGKADDPAWARAPAATWDTDYAGHPTGITTRARFLWKEGTLYALWELSKAGLNVDAKFPVDAERKDLYVEDCVELLLVPRADEPTRFYEIELGPLGHHYDLAIDRRAKVKEDPAWSSGAVVKASHDAATHTAVIEAAISGPDVAALLRAGNSLLLGLFRMEGRKPRSYLAWHPARTPKPNFHVPEAFGALRFDP
jgi:uncharacterized protein (DUF362 family)